MISIFAKRAFLNTDPHQPFKKENYHGRGHLMRVSSIIRGDQIADAIGARYNPIEGYRDDVCIYVKPHLKKGSLNFNFEGRKAYLDIIDGHNLGAALKNYPDVGCIVCSRADEEVMKQELDNEVVYIPQHHCNFNRLKRTQRGIKRCGVIGTEPQFDWLPDGIEKELAYRGIELVKFSKFLQRQDIIDFYLSIDLQVVWRPHRKILSNPLKIVNASSFGIPTIAYDEPAFREMDDCYIPVTTLDEFFKETDKLRSQYQLYFEYSQRCLMKSEFYHIENVAKMYQELDK